MRKIVFTFNLVLLIFFVISCQDKRVEEVPISSDEHFPQVYFLKDKSIDCDFSISFDSLRSLEKKLKLKFHFKVVETKEQFLETLKRWNARPIDFLFVLTNRFVEDFTSLRLVKKPNLRQYLISDSQALKITSDIKSLLLNEEDLKSFEKFYFCLLYTSPSPRDNR